MVISKQGMIAEIVMDVAVNLIKGSMAVIVVDMDKGMAVIMEVFSTLFKLPHPLSICSNTSSK